MQRLIIEHSQLQGQTLQLTPDQVHYLQTVLRLKAGSLFIVQDGQGRQWQAALSTVAQQAELVQSLAPLPVNPPLMLAAALPKTGFDDVVRQATEIGVTAIQPLLSQRTLLQPSPQKLSRWQRIAQEAAEQSERGIPPKIYPPALYANWLSQNLAPNSANLLRYIAVARGDYPRLFAHAIGALADDPHQPMTILIGPEGGWSPEEIAVAIANHYQPVSLNSGILRATTASIVAISALIAARDQLI